MQTPDKFFRGFLSCSRLHKLIGKICKYIYSTTTNLSCDNGDELRVRECEAVNLIEQSKPYANSIRLRTATAAAAATSTLEFTPTIASGGGTGRGGECANRMAVGQHLLLPMAKARNTEMRRRCHMKGHDRLRQSCVRPKAFD